MRVLFVAIPERGHLTPLVAVAQRLERDGHDVAFFAHGDVAGFLSAAGLAARTFGPPPEGGAERRGTLRLDDVAWLARWFQLGTASVLRDTMLRPVLEAMRSFHPDVMAVDPLAYHGVAAAEGFGVPWAGLSTNFAAVTPEGWPSVAAEAYRRIAAWRAELFSSHGIVHPVRFNEVLSPWLRIAFATEAFLGTSAEGFALVGPAVLQRAPANEPFPWDELSLERPIVYVSPGAGESAPLDDWNNVLASVVTSLEADEAQFVAVLPERIRRRGQAALPSSVLIVEFAPQLQLLKRVDVVVTAGGANTVTESLMNGKPMLVLPLVNDQPLQGWLVERSGVGFQLNARGLDPSTCRDRLLRLLDPAGAPRARARAVSESYGVHDGAERAAELIVELGRVRRPMLAQGAARE